MSYAEIYDVFIEGMNDLNSAIDEYMPISEYAAVFEADNPDIQKTAEANDKTAEKGDNAIIKVLKAIKRIVLNVITSIKNFFDKAKLSTEQKQAYELFKKACAENPEFKNKKITVRAWQEIEKRGAALHAEGERLLREEAENPTACEEFVSKAAQFCKDTASSVGSSIAVDAAMRYMEYSPAVADKVLADMQRDKQWCEKLEGQIGSKGVKKFENYAKKMRTKSRVGMWLARIGKSRYDSLADATNATLKGVKGIATGHVGNKESLHVLNTLGKNEKVGGFVSGVAKSAGKQIIKDKTKAVSNKFSAEGRYAKADYDLKHMTQGKNETDREFQARREKQEKKVNSIANRKVKDYERKNKYNKKDANVLLKVANLF